MDVATYIIRNVQASCQKKKKKSVSKKKSDMPKE